MMMSVPRELPEQKAALGLVHVKAPVVELTVTWAEASAAEAAKAKKVAFMMMSGRWLWVVYERP